MIGATFTIEFDGMRFEFPEIDDRDLVHNRIKSGKTFYEDELLRFLAENITGPGIALDCGANIGNHTLFFAGVMQLRTLAVEPVARNYQILERVIELNGLSGQAEVVKMALDDHEGEVVMTLDSPGNPGMYKVGNGAGTSVRSTTLDALCQNEQGQIRVIKIDVEGFQDQVIRGARAVIERDKPIIAAELTTESEYRSFCELIVPNGYVPVTVFNRTPTIVFCGDGTLPDGSDAVTSHLRSYARRMRFLGPIQRTLQKIGLA